MSIELECTKCDWHGYFPNIKTEEKKKGYMKAYEECPKCQSKVKLK